MLKHSELSQHLLNRPAQLMEMKEKGIKVVGYNAGDFVPEELIYAAGAVPVCQIHGGDTASVEAAHSMISRQVCPFARAQIGYRWLKEEPYYGLVDMLIIALTCQHLKKAADVWNYFTDVPVFRLGLSLDQKNPEGFSYFVESLKRTREKLEGFTGNKITDEKLQQAISLYNRIRGLLNKISLMRQPEHLPISTLDFIKLNHASYLADPKVMVEALDSICHELEQQKKKPSSGKPKLLLIAPNIALGDYKILRVIEEAGGEICCEEICEGVRTYSVNVGTNGRDPLEALAIKYIKNREVPCAFMTDSIRPRFDYAVKLAKKFQVDGVIWYQLKMCETYDIESVFFAKHLREHNLPMLKLESEYDLSDKQQLSTRIEAFLETLERRVS
jgi:benzoyl-CoA reductase/2-hydroxyglutaryl-CoA dehydratase subunit BcrC/BadD/HgdB